MSKYDIEGIPTGKIRLDSLTEEQRKILTTAGSGTGMTLEAYVKAVNKTRKGAASGKERL